MTTNAKQRPVASTRPKRLAAVRQAEKMVVWSSRLNAEHVDWFDEDDEETSVGQMTLPSSENDHNTIPIIDLEKRMSLQWQEI